jgi:hypothetical protein
MGLGVRTGKPPDSGESAAADLRSDGCAHTTPLREDEVIVLGGDRTTST